MYRISVITGDGIGPEIVPVATSLLEAVLDRMGVSVEFRYYPAGDQALKTVGSALPEETLKAVGGSDATLKGPVGETARDVIVTLRQYYDLYVNLRPAKTYEGVDSIKPGVDLVIVRENTEDLYVGYEFEVPGAAIALKVITERSSRRVAEYAFRLAARRRRKLTVVHKSNVLKLADGLFARVARETSKAFPEVEFGEMYVDAMAMALVKSPEEFDVILTPNLYGDILSDEAAQVVGGLGLAPSANIGDERAIFEPVHGSAPDIAGKGVANPYAIVLSTVLMTRWLGERKNDDRLIEASKFIDDAVRKLLRMGVKTPDLGGRYKTTQVRDWLLKIVGVGL